LRSQAGPGCRRRASWLVALSVFLTAVGVVTAPLAADLRLARSEGEIPQILRDVAGGEPPAAEAPPEEAAEAPREGEQRILVLGITAFTENAPDRSVLPYARLYWRRPLSEDLELELWLAGVFNRLGVQTRDAALERDGWGWRIELSAMPFRLSDELYFDGANVTAEKVGAGSAAVRFSLFAGNPAYRAGGFYEAGYRFFGRDEDTAPGFVVPRDTVVHRAGVFGHVKNLRERNRLGMYTDTGFIFHGEAYVGHRQDWGAWGAPGFAAETDATYFRAHFGMLGQLPAFREGDKFVFRLKGGLGSGLDRWSALPVGSPLVSDPVGDAARAGGIVRGFLGRQFRTDGFGSVNLEYRLRLHEWVYLHLCVDGAAFNRITPQTVGADGASGAVGVGIGLTTGFFWQSRLRFDYGVGVVGPDGGDSGIHEFRLSIVKRF
jgi:hypothetical protein